MFKTLANSWHLVKASASVLRSDKELLIFPIISAIGVVIVTITFAVPTILTGFFEGIFAGEGTVILHYVVVFFFYLAQYMVIIFANSALVGAAMIRLEGGNPTIGDGLRIATKKLGSILGFAAVSATVGLVLSWLSSRGKIGDIMAQFIGIGWNLAVFLVVPVLVVEGVGPIEAVKRSSRLLKKTWGEQIVGNLGMGLVFALIYIPILIVGALAIFLGIGSDNKTLLIGAVAATILAVLVLALIHSALSGIYRAAVYRYATTGETGGFFDEGMVKGAFKPKS